MALDIGCCVSSHTFGVILDLVAELRATDREGSKLVPKVHEASQFLKFAITVNWSDQLPGLKHMAKEMKETGIQQAQAKCDVLEKERKRFDATYRRLRDQILKFYRTLGMSILWEDIGSLVLRNLTQPKLKMMREVCRGFTVLMCILFTETREHPVKMQIDWDKSGRLLILPRRMLHFKLSKKRKREKPC
jgi:hypothetical protein